MKVALYGRVSTKDKGQDTENQLAQLRAFAVSRNSTVVVVRKMNSVATQPPSQGHIHDASRRVRISSQPDIREAAGVCARWAGPDPTWAQADRDLTTNVASRGYSAWSSPE